MGLSRRSFLHLAGLTGGALMMPSFVRPANAQATLAPRRVLFIYTTGGAVFKYTHMRPPFLTPEQRSVNPYDQTYRLTPDDSQWEFSFTDPRLSETDFSRILHKFYRHRSKMTVLEGLSYFSSAFPGVKGDGHARGFNGMLTGAAGIFEDGVKAVPIEPSLDQRIHEALLVDNPSHQVLNFQTWENRQGGQTFHGIHWSRNPTPGGPAYRVTPEDNPLDVYNRLFGGLDVGADPMAAGRPMALDLALAQYERLGVRLPLEDRRKLKAHRDLLNQLRAQLGSTLSCTAPLGPASGSGLDAEALYRSDVEAFARMIGAGFGCGLSRVATLGLNYLPKSMYGVDPAADIHHTYEHPSDPFFEFDQYQGNLPESYVTARELMTRRNEVTAELVARVVDILSEIPENGGSLLDSTLVVYVTDISHGDHGQEQIIATLFGGCGGAVQPGRYIKYPQNNPNPWNRNYLNEYTGVPYSHLLISIAQAMGLPIDHIAETSISGSVPHRGIAGTVSLTGPLAHLT